MSLKRKKNKKDKLSILWFSQIADYNSLLSSLYASKSLFEDDAEYFVNLDDSEKIYLDVENVQFNHSNFDQNKNTGGIDRIIGELETFKRIHKQTGNRLLLKQDSDVVCYNKSFLNYVDNKHTFFGQVAEKDTNPYGYGAAYVINCEKLDFSNLKPRLEDLDDKYDNLFSSRGWSEDLTIHYFCKEHGETLLLDKTKNPKWMSFIDYKDEYLLSFLDAFFSEDYPIDWDYFNSSFINCGYGFGDTQYRDIVMKMLCFKSSQENTEESQEEDITEVKNTIIEFPTS